MISNFNAGFVAFIGRSNVGKSTLVNSLIDKKISITSSKPNTTRHAIHGIINNDIEKYQLIIVDTPGSHKPKTLLGRRLNSTLEQVITSVDILAFCIPVNEKIGPGDKFIAKKFISYNEKRPVIAIATKIDKVSKNLLAKNLTAINNFGEEILENGFNEIIPVSYKDNLQIKKTSQLLSSYLPISPKLYFNDEYSSQTNEKTISEFIRESLLQYVSDELPHSIEVSLNKVDKRINKKTNQLLTCIHAIVFVERDSQKGIVIGKNGLLLKTIGTKARKKIEIFLNTNVFLKIVVKVNKNWQQDSRKLNNLGF